VLDASQRCAVVLQMARLGRPEEEEEELEEEEEEEDHSILPGIDLTNPEEVQLPARRVGGSANASCSLLILFAHAQAYEHLQIDPEDEQAIKAFMPAIPHQVATWQRATCSDACRAAVTPGPGVRFTAHDAGGPDHGEDKG
jgi:hypothetical protein